MDAETSRDVIDALRANGYRPRSYSGRGMYGKRCIGVALERPSLKESNAICAVVDRTLNTVVGYPVDWDALGLGSIVYFPNLPWPEDVIEGSDTDTEEG